jgi:hypothetical protein
VGKALEGVRVLDMTHVQSGPITKMNAPAQPGFREVTDANNRVYRVGETDRELLGRSRAWMVWLPWAAIPATAGLQPRDGGPSEVAIVVAHEAHVHEQTALAATRWP